MFELQLSFVAQVAQHLDAAVVTVGDKDAAIARNRQGFHIVVVRPFEMKAKASLGLGRRCGSWLNRGRLWALLLLKLIQRTQQGVPLFLHITGGCCREIIALADA